MRVLFTTTGHPGHVLPLVLFARAARQAGHEVGVVGARAPRATSENRGLESREGAVGDIVRLTGTWRPHVVVHESHEFAGYLAAERHGIPHVRLALGLERTEQTLISLVASAMQEPRAELDLAADPNADGIRSAPCLTLVPRALDSGCPHGAVHRFREPRRSVAALPDWWPEDAGPLVYVTFGPLAGALGYFPTLYRDTMEALADVPARVLVTVGTGNDPIALGSAPRNVHVERWVAYERAIAHADAIVCHGGHGLVIGALAAGRPLVVIPLFGDDQWDNARRIASIGAGIQLAGTPRTMFEYPGRDVQPELPHAIERVLEDRSYGAAAQRVAADVASLPPIEAAPDVLAAIAEAHQRTEVARP